MHVSNKVEQKLDNTQPTHQNLTIRSEKISRDFCHTGGGSRNRSSCGAGQKCVAEYHYKQMMLTCDDGSRRPFDVKFTTGCNCKAESRRKPPFFWIYTGFPRKESSFWSFSSYTEFSEHKLKELGELSVLVPSALNCHIFFIPLNYRPLFNSFKEKLSKNRITLTPDRLFVWKRYNVWTSQFSVLSLSQHCASTFV